MSPPDLSDASILYLSVTISPQHPCAELFRRRIDRGPDRDLCRIIDSSGEWIRPYFRRVVITSVDDLDAVAANLDGIRGVICGGSFHSWVGLREDLASWQRRTLKLVEYLIHDRQLPYLGLCGGGQVALLASGGGVAANPEGTGIDGVVVRTEQLSLTAAGLEDPIFEGCPSEVSIQAIHNDHFALLPAGARVLARAEEFPAHAVALGDRIRIFQPHPELTVDYARRLLRTLEDHLVLPESLPRLRQATQELQPSTVVNERVVRNFLHHFCA